MLKPIRIRGARAHNLRGTDLEVPHHRLVVVTGVSGSGKSSLAFDTICREGQRRYLESFSARARQLLGKLGQADVESIDHLSPAIALDQKTSVRSPRSTVGTLSELNDHLRLLLARLGRAPDDQPVHRRDLSFNSTGACPACRGLGVEDAIDPEKLIDDPAKTLRQGALVITTDSGYIIYSQVTMDVLNQVCEAHGFDVDIPWRDLTAEQRHVVLYGSDRLEIPFGKHTLESRMKWSGITARPRQTGFYGGIVPVMEQILKRDRNRNILRFVRTGPCTACGGTRLNERARSVTFAGRSLPEFGAMTVDELATFFEALDTSDQPVAAVVVTELLQRASLLRDLGLGYLTLHRDAPSLSGGEAQRIRLASMVGSGLRGLTYVFDEPSMGLHPRDQQRLLRILRRLVDQGNTVIAVEHDRQTMLAADWLIDLGPGAGRDGGEVLFAGPPRDLLANSSVTSPTAAYLRGELAIPDASPRAEARGVFTVADAHRHNLQHLTVDIPREALTVVSGVSGAGKSTLLGELADAAGEQFAKLITIDQAPIGRTPRSNPATYTGLFDHLRALFAAEPLARELGLKKGVFSFNNKGGRCAVCEGAGVKRLGMHFLGDVEIACEACGGRRFDETILRVRHRGLTVSDVLDLPIAEAAQVFADEPKLARHLEVLVELGLGYITLGQPSTTLSGGEAQRVKLAAELSRPQVRDTLYLLDEPTTGLHAADVAVLLRALDRLVRAGGTVVVSEHHEMVLRFADHVVDLGPESGCRGGELVFAGTPHALKACAASITGRMLADTPEIAPHAAPEAAVMDGPIALRGVQTNNLQNIDVDLPVGRISVVTGVSGSGKSSLALDTLHAEGRNRYAENFSTYVRQQLGQRTRPDLASSHGLMPSVAIGQSAARSHPRSTVATAAEIHPLLRLLYSRIGQVPTGRERPTAGFFSFNHAEGACAACRGLGRVTVCDPERLVSDPEHPLIDGALDGHKTGRFYGERDGQYVATLLQVGRELDHDFSRPWAALSADARRVAMHGAGERVFDVTWQFKRGKNQGEHNFRGAWVGFCGLVEEEYQRKHADHRGRDMLPVMAEHPCHDCGGGRHAPAVLEITVAGSTIADLCALSVDDGARFFADATAELGMVPQLCDEVARRLASLQRVGLGYLGLDRATATLSGGEFRRLRLVRQLGVRLQGVTVVLDEPTLGLHPRDTARLWPVLEELRDQGNTVVLVEHDPEVIRLADHVIDVGPGAGKYGGRIMATGTAADIQNEPTSITGQWLGRDLDVDSQPATRSSEPHECLTIRGAHQHNLQHIDMDITVGALTAVTGVSGSGKTSLVFGVLAASAEAGRPVGCQSVDGLEQFTNVIAVRPGAGVATGAGSPATAAALSPLLRKLLAGTPEAKDAGLAARHFGTTGKGGRCEACQGTGRHDVALDFMADVQTPCAQCHGTGFTESVLECRWQGRNIAEIMALSVDEALGFFADEARIIDRLQVLADAGLSYLRLGQPSRTLSGGERQRLHLACRLLAGSRETDLYLCDEPTAGLHMADIAQLAGLLQRLTAAGHTVVVTEHNAQLIRHADRIIELGPGAGAAGGRLQG